MIHKNTPSTECTDTYLTLFDMFDKAGVPPEPQWRSLLLFFREIKDNNLLSDAQKISIQTLMANIIEKRDYSPKRLHSAFKEYHDILTKPYKTQVDLLVQEAASVISDLQKRFSIRFGDITSLEEETVTIVAEMEDHEDSIAKLRKTFSKVKNLFEEDLHHLENLTTLDSITKISNRRGFDQFMNTAIEKWIKESCPLALAIFDIDHFKRFNDEYGHRIGDQVLAVVGGHFKKILFEFDDSDVLAARYGGEEFALVVSGPGAHKLPVVTKKCCDIVRKFNFLIRDADGNVVENNIHITLSAGVTYATKRWQGAYLENLIDNADRAMYHAKKSGRDACYEFRPDSEDAFVLI